MKEKLSSQLTESIRLNSDNVPEKQCDRTSSKKLIAVNHNEVIISLGWVAFLNPTEKIGDHTQPTGDAIALVAEYFIKKY